LDGVDTLATAKAFVEEQKKLKELLALYATLVNKDAQDLASIIVSTREADAIFGATIR